MKNSIKGLVFGLMIVGVLIPFAAQAQTPTTYTPLAPLPCIQGNGIDCSSAGGNGQLAKTVSFQTYVQYTFNLLIALAAVAAVFMMVYGGFLYMTSSAVNTKEDGLKKVYNAVGGLALVLCSFLILRTINPQFVNIPSSLVTPLNLKSDNLTNNWMNAMNEVLSVGAVNANNAATRQQVADANTQLTQLSNQANSLEAEISDLTGASDATQACFDYTGDDSEMNSLCTALISNLNQRNTLQSNTTFSVAKSTMDNLTIGGGTTLGHDCSATGDPQTCADQALKIGLVYTSLSGQLQPDQVTQLASYAQYSTAIVNMEKQSALLYQQTAQGTVMSAATGNPLVSSAGGNYPKMYQDTLTSISAAADAYIKSPNPDPALVSKLKTEQQKITAVVTTMRFHLAP